MQEPEGLSLLESVLRAAGEQWTVVGEDSRHHHFGALVIPDPPDELHRADLTRVVHPDDLTRMYGLVEAMDSHQTVEASSVRVRVGSEVDGWRPCEMWLMDRRGDPSIGGIVCRLRLLSADEIDASPLPDGAISRPTPPPRRVTSDDAFASLAEVVPAAILTADASGRVVYTNQELRRLLQAPVQELEGDGWRDIVHPDDVRSVAQASLSALAGTRAEVLFRIDDREDLRWLHGRMSPMWSGGEIVGMVAVFDDVTAQREHEASLAHRATHDPLTGLPNRLLLRDRLSQALGRQAREAGSVVVLFIDLDTFKDVNDNYGHSVGDELLVEIARRLSLAVRPTDTVARLGGDEFIVVSDGLDLTEAEALTMRMLDRIAEPVQTTATTIEPSASIGVAFAVLPTTVDEMIHQADAAMYRAKRAGRGGTEFVTLH